MRLVRKAALVLGVVFAVGSLLPGAPATAQTPEECLADATAAGVEPRSAIASCLGGEAAENATASDSSTASSFCYLIPTAPWASTPVSGVGNRAFIVYGTLIYCDQAITASVATMSLQTSTETTLDTRTGTGTVGSSFQTILAYGVCPTRLLSYRTRVEAATVTTSSLTTHNFLFKNSSSAFVNCLLV